MLTMLENPVCESGGFPEAGSGLPSAALPFISAQWPKNARESVRVALAEYRGSRTVDLRTWYDAGDGNLRPGPKGLTLDLRHLPALAHGLNNALAHARASGLLPEGGGT